MKWVSSVAIFFFLSASVNAIEMDHGSHHGMRLDIHGMVMNENLDQVPVGCEGRIEDISIDVVADHTASKDFPGTIFSLTPAVIQIPSCARVHVRFKNKDQVRHQWMVHGLPRFMYPGGMFHLEANAGRTVSGVFIVPVEDKTYLIHCDISQHMQKGMKAMLIVGEGDGEIAGVPGVTGNFFSRPPGSIDVSFGFILLGLLFFGSMVIFYILCQRKK